MYRIESQLNPVHLHTVFLEIAFVDIASGSSCNFEHVSHPPYVLVSILTHIC